MSRPWVLRVADWPALQAAVLYLLRVVSVDKSTVPSAVRVELEFVEEEQAGRTYVALLPLPLRSAGLTADFFRAAGVDTITAGGTVMPKVVVGKVVRAGFGHTDEDGEWQIVRFMPASAP